MQLDRRYDARRREADANRSGEGRAGGPLPLGPGAESPVLSLERDVQDFLLVLGLAQPPNVETGLSLEWNLERTQASARRGLAQREGPPALPSAACAASRLTRICRGHPPPRLPAARLCPVCR